MRELTVDLTYAEHPRQFVRGVMAFIRESAELLPLHADPEPLVLELLTFSRTAKEGVVPGLKAHVNISLAAQDSLLRVKYAYSSRQSKGIVVTLELGPVGIDDLHPPEGGYHVMGVDMAFTRHHPRAPGVRF
jgi:hypothetical protein